MRGSRGRRAWTRRGGPAGGPGAFAGARPEPRRTRARPGPRRVAWPVAAGIWISPSPLNPADVGSASSAGNSSTRTYLSGSSIEISNSMGTRLLPRIRRVRPEATSVLSAASLSPPSALRTSASACPAFWTDSGLGAAAPGRALGRRRRRLSQRNRGRADDCGRAANAARHADAMVLPVNTAK